MGRQLGKTIREFRDATSDIRSQIGIDDIADSVKDIKSGLSLTSTDGAANAAAVATPAAIGTPDATVTDAPQIDTSSAPLAARSANRPVASGAPPAAPVVRNGPVAAGAPAPAPSSVTAPLPVAAPSPAADDAGTGVEGGVEAFGKLTRRSASSSVRPTAD